MPSARRDAHRAIDSGLYQLVVRLCEVRDIGVGRHGRFRFPAGFYVYTGSARRGLEARIARHTRRRKRMIWHVNDLLRYGRILGVKRATVKDGRGSKHVTWQTWPATGAAHSGS